MKIKKLGQLYLREERGEESAASLISKCNHGAWAAVLGAAAVQARYAMQHPSLLPATRLFFQIRISYRPHRAADSIRAITHRWKEGDKA